MLRERRMRPRHSHNADTQRRSEHPFLLALSAGITAAVIGVIAQYFITYLLIEKPKVDLERQKTLLEAHRFVSKLMPRIDVECRDSAIDGGTRIRCTFKNTGHHPARVKYVHAALIATPDGERDQELDAQPTSRNVSVGEQFPWMLYPGESIDLRVDYKLKGSRLQLLHSTGRLAIRVHAPYEPDADIDGLYLKEFPALRGSFAARLLLAEQNLPLLLGRGKP